MGMGGTGMGGLENMNGGLSGGLGASLSSSLGMDHLQLGSLGLGMPQPARSLPLPKLPKEGGAADWPRQGTPSIQVPLSPPPEAGGPRVQQGAEHELKPPRRAQSRPSSVGDAPKHGRLRR